LGCQQLLDYGRGDDAMQFSTTSIEVPKTCKQFTVTLKHTGKLPKTAMGHNWALTRADDQAGVLADGSSAGLASNYVKPKDSRVIAHTRIIGGGETDTTTFKVAALKAGQPYVFFCSFPGHAALMKGTLSLTQ
jgi:azurin